MNLSLLVIRAKDLEENLKFYSQLCMVFKKEKHGAGPVHYSSTFSGMVFEIYPCRDKESPTNNRLGFKFKKSEPNYSGIEQWAQEVAESSYLDPMGIEYYIVLDPDHRKVEVGFER